MGLQPYNYDNKGKSSKETSNTRNRSGLVPFKYEEYKKPAPVIAPEKQKTKVGQIISDVKDVAKGVPAAAKQIVKEVVKNPLRSAQSVVLGAADVGNAIVNTGLNIAGSKARLPLLSKEFSKVVGSNDVQDSLSTASTQGAGYALGARAFKGLGFTNKVVNNVGGDVVGGQATMAPESTGMDRVKQALFDATFGIATVGVPAGFKRLKNGKVVKLTPEEAANMRAWGSKDRPTVPAAGTPPQGYVNPARTLSAPAPKTDFYVGKDGTAAKDIRGAARLGTQPRREVINGETFTNEKVDYEPYIPDDQLPVITAGDRVSVPRNEFKAEPLKPTPAKDPNIVTLPKPQAQNTARIEVPKSSKIAQEPRIQPKTVDSPSQPMAPLNKPDDFVETPEFKQRVQKRAKVLESEDIPGFDPTTRVQQTSIYEKLMAQGEKDKIIRIAKGIEDGRDVGLNKFAAYRLASTDALSAEDIMSLQRSEVKSQAGQDLSMGNLGDKDNAVDIVRDLRKMKEAAVSKKQKVDVAAEADRVVKELDKTLKNVKESQSIVDDILDSFTCRV